LACIYRIVLLEADARRPKSEIRDHGRHLGVERLRIGLVDLDPLDPRFATGELFGKCVENNYWFAGARPHHHEATHRARNVEVPGQRPRHRHTGQVREIYA
jgi:hypothetical protein